MIERKASLGPLAVEQSLLANDRLQDRYDLCLGVASWESRATTAFKALPERDALWEVWSFASDDAERAHAKSKCFSDLSSLRKERVDLIELSGSLQYERNFEVIQSHLGALRDAHSRPLDVLLDMTCMPKKYMLYFLGMAFRNEFVRTIDFVYSEGIYGAPNEREPAGALSWSGSEGEWSSVQVPYFEGDSFMPDSRGLVVSLGAEISASVPFIERYEPALISLVSVEDDPSRIDTSAIEKERRLLHELSSLPITTSNVFQLGDLLGVADSCRAFCRERPEMHVTGLAIGSKPHALALGLAALSVHNFEIVCRLPSKYLLGDVAETGRIFLYRTSDRFEPR